MRFLADEDFDNDILRGLQNVLGKDAPDFDVIRVQDMPEIYQQSDSVVLEWAATEKRILLTHDRNTMTAWISERLAAGLPMPGAFIVSRAAPVGKIIDELLVVIGASDPAEWQNRAEFLPMQ